MKKLIALFCIIFTSAAFAYTHPVQNAWDNPNANMAAGSSKPGYAQLSWTSGTTIPIKLRNGMVTMITFPEPVADGVIGMDGLFKIEKQKGARQMFISPDKDNQGSDTNMIVTGVSGNTYLLYLRSEPNDASEITYSQVDIVAEGGVRNVNGPINVGGGEMRSLFSGNGSKAGGNIGVDGEDYGWIKTVKIDPSEFRFDMDIFVPNPDDFVVAPERVWRDRIFTYIDFGDKVIAMTQRPVVSILIEGGESPVGFRTDGDNGRLLIVEAVGDMVLRSGQRIVCIKKRAKPFLIADTASVMALAEANVAQSWASQQSLNNVSYNGMPMAQPMMGSPMAMQYQQQMMPGQPMMQPMMPAGAARSAGGAQVPTLRETAGAYLPGTGIPLISSNQRGVAVELKTDTSVKLLNDYWNNLLTTFAGSDGNGLLMPYKDRAFFAVDDSGVGELGEAGASAQLYRLRVGPIADMDEAQKLCESLLKFNGTSCNVIRVQ